MNHNRVFDNGIIVFDGGIGTELYGKGFFINRPFEELNLNSPGDVLAVHEAYIKAGANVITTNTFSISRPQLKKFDIEDKQSEIIKAALEIANKARKGTDVKVAFSIGPTGVLIEPLGPTSRKQVRSYFAEIASCALKQENFDLYILETYTNISELEDAIEGIRSVDSKTPILASFAPIGHQENLIQNFMDRIAHREDIQAVGLNCGQGPSDLYKILKQIGPSLTKPIIIQPNAGIPNQLNGRYFYMTSPDYMAKYAKNFVEAGAAGVGGCCGTGPDHIRAIRNAVRMLNSKHVKAERDLSAEKKDSPKIQITQRPLSERKQSFMGQKLQENRKIFSIEVLPPKGPDVEKFLLQLEQIDQNKIDFVNVPDGPRASTRISSMHVASLVNRNSKFNLKVLPHFTTRDRNLIALQSDLLGAYVNCVYDVLVVTGDPPKLGNNREATSVYDVDAIGLTYMMNCLNKGVSPKGENLGKPTNFGIGVAANPTAINMDLEKQRWAYKCESGADFAVTQPIFDPDSYLRWREETSSNNRPHLVGIWPFISYANAEFLAHEVPGVKVPESVLQEMEKTKDNKDEAIKRGIEIALQTMKKLENSCEGFCVNAPLGKVEVALELIKLFRK